MSTTADTVARPLRLWPAIGWTLLMLGAIGAAGNAIAFLGIDDLGTPAIKDRFMATAVAGWAHTLGGAIAALIGPLQFLPAIRNRAPAVHVWLGRTYLVSVVASALAGFFFAQTSVAGVIGTWGFGILAVFWLYSATLAFLSIRRGQVAEHRRWMIRNYALTFAAVTLRIELALLMIAGLTFTTAMQIVAWLCWMPNWLVVEAWMKRKR